MNDNPVDDSIINRKSKNINIKKLFNKPTQNHFLNYSTQSYYTRNTCLDNREFSINLKRDGYVGEGSYGVARKGKYMSGSTIKSGIIKIIINGDDNQDEFNELKYGIEANMIVPNSVVSFELIEKCNLLKNSKYIHGHNDVIIPTNEILIIGMEEGSDFSTRLESLLDANNVVGFERLLDEALFTCDEFNKNGFFHRDMKPGNIIISTRDGTVKPILIDFGHTCYMKKIENITIGRLDDLSSSNPPLDSFFLLLFIDRHYNSASVADIIFNKMIKYYSILRYLRMYDTDIEHINYYLFYAYKLNENFSNFLNKIKKNGIRISRTPDISRSVDDRMRYSSERTALLNQHEIKFSRNKFLTLKNALQNLMTSIHQPNPASSIIHNHIPFGKKPLSPIQQSPSPVIQKSPTPIVIKRKSPSPIVVKRKSPSPVVVKRKSPSPVVVKRKSPTPIVVKRKSPTPIDVKRKSPTPIVVKRKSPTPIVVKRKSSSPVVVKRKSSNPVVVKKSPVNNPKMKQFNPKEIKWPINPYFKKISILKEKLKKKTKNIKKIKHSIYSPPSIIQSPSEYIPGKYKMPIHRANSPIISTNVHPPKSPVIRPHVQSPKYMKLERYIIPDNIPQEYIMYERYPASIKKKSQVPATDVVKEHKNLKLKNCFDRKRKNGDDLTTEEAKVLCKANRLKHTGTKKELCIRLRNNIPPLCL